MIHPNALDEQLESLRTLQQSYDQIAGAAEAYNVGKTQLAAAISGKGVETSPTESYPEMAEKVNAISQETYEINGGEMYAKQLFGSLTTPNYWNLYEVLADLLTDGNVPEWNEEEQTGYGGILLAEYYKGYASFAFDSQCSAGAGGGYVFSDDYEKWKAGLLPNFPIQTNDNTHYWDDDTDGKGNRWIAFLFAGEGHGFTIGDTNRCPRSIFIGRNVGAITSNINGRVSEIVVPDGSSLASFNSDGYSQNFGRVVVLRNIDNLSSGSIFYGDIETVESVYIQAKTIATKIFNATGNGKKISVKSLIIKCNSLSGSLWYNSYVGTYDFSTIQIDAHSINVLVGGDSFVYTKTENLKTLSIYNTEECYFEFGSSTDAGQNNIRRVFVGYGNENNKLKSVSIVGRKFLNVSDLELKDGWCKPLNLVGGSGNYKMSLTEENMYAHILQRLKQDEANCGDGVTITLGATNLAKLTSEESVQLLDDLTNIYGYTFA